MTANATGRQVGGVGGSGRGRGGATEGGGDGVMGEEKEEEEPQLMEGGARGCSASESYSVSRGGESGSRLSLLLLAVHTHLNECKRETDTRARLAWTLELSVLFKGRADPFSFLCDQQHFQNGKSI